MSNYKITAKSCELKSTSGIYFQPLERGWLYLFVSTVLLFLMSDGLAYYIHRSGHHPVLYKHIHKWHHRYHSPTAFSATAMHPAEFIALEGALAVPMFVMPIYSGAFIMVLLYNYYYGLMDHSGMFHDNHHKYFHTNFGFNTLIWDKLHDTLRRDNRIYGEDIFGGRGITPEKNKEVNKESKHTKDIKQH